MRLCFIADGNSLHIKRWANYFAQRGHDVHLISTRFPEGYKGYDNTISMHHLLRLFPGIWNVSGYLSGIVWLLQVRRLVHTIKPDVLDAHYVGVPAYLGIASGFHPFIMSAWGSDILIDPEKSILRRILTKYTVRRADRIICVSPTLKENLIRLGALPDSVYITPIGVDTYTYNPESSNRELLKQLDLGDSPIIISTRSLKSVYNVETLVKAIPMVLEEIPIAKFIIGGLGEQRKYLESMVQTLGVADSVIFLGWISDSDYPSYLASSDIYVSTSISDGTSISLLEALACKLAPVVSDIQANRPWIEDGETGFLFPVGSYEILAKRIIQMLRDPNMRNVFGEKGRQKVIELAEFQNEMLKVEELYKETIMNTS
jgi:glycosyltransferase involved in cell wall biosynthesis